MFNFAFVKDEQPLRTAPTLVQFYLRLVHFSKFRGYRRPYGNRYSSFYLIIYLLYNMKNVSIIMEKRFDILDFKTLNDFSYVLMKVRHELGLCKIYEKEENIDDFLQYISQLYSDVC